MDFSFFLTDNQSGYKTQEKWLSKNHPELYKEIINYNNEVHSLEMNFKEKIWFYFNKLTSRPKCKTCGKEIKFRNRFDKAYGEFCSLNCINTNKEEMISRIKESIKVKYDVNYYPQHEEFIKKVKATKLLKYGDENYNNISKINRTKIERYGDGNYVNHEKYKATCIEKYNNENYTQSSTFKEIKNKKFKELYPDINILSINKLMVNIKCGKCNNDYTITKQLIYERTKMGYETCINCNPIGNSQKSGYEFELGRFINELGVDFLSSDRVLMNGKEIDILIPNNMLAIEFNGLYWHNELFVDKNYHLEKTRKANENGYQLIHIFEDEWKYKKDIVKSIIRNKLNKIENAIYGRKCIIKLVNNKESNEFLNNNHIQGAVKSKVRIGLYYNNQLVSLMTFSKGRIIMGGKENEWELTRFVNLINHNVIGGASKLFNFFLKNYKPIKIISYSDIRLFDGKMYKNLGFKKIHQSPPNYWYVINDLRYYRFNFRKSILIKEGFDKNKTEKEIMFDRKIYRIYDCGNIRWEFL
jgi:hypothetical protein